MIIDCGACAGTGTNQGSGEECRPCSGCGQLEVKVIGPARAPDTRTPEERALAIERQYMLIQDELWFPKEGGPIRLVDMSNRYLTNVQGFLRRRAGSLKSAAEWQLTCVAGQHHGDMAQDGIDAELDRLLEVDSDEWLSDQPLTIKITELVAAGHDGPID